MRLRCLVITDITGIKKEKTIVLDRSNHFLKIGRNSKKCDIVLDDMAISRIHATIVNLAFVNNNFSRKMQGEHLILDGDFGSGSTNGLYINNQKFTTHILKINDCIELGRYQIYYKESIIEENHTDETEHKICHHSNL